MAEPPVPEPEEGQEIMSDILQVGCGLALFALWAAAIAAWITHVIVCIKASAWILLLFGCLVAPVGVIHGFGVWIGVF